MNSQRNPLKNLNKYSDQTWLEYVNHHDFKKIHQTIHETLYKADKSKSLHEAKYYEISSREVERTNICMILHPYSRNSPRFSKVFGRELHLNFSL